MTCVQVKQWLLARPELLNDCNEYLTPNSITAFPYYTLHLRYGSTPLHQAACFGHLDIVKLLVEANAVGNMRAAAEAAAA